MRIDPKKISDELDEELVREEFNFKIQKKKKNSEKTKKEPPCRNTISIQKN